MLIISAFEYSRNLETAVKAVEMNGIPKNQIMVVPLDKHNSKLSLFDSFHAQDGYNLFDIPMILAALFSLFGLIYGFILYLGPIFWALIGTGTGFGLGLTIKLIVMKKKMKSNGKTQAVLIVQCNKEQSKTVQNTLLGYSFLNVGVVEQT